METKNKNKKGISLIVLIMTIIVVIILAAIIIITITKNNPVDSAKEATFKQDVRSFQDELSMYIGNENIKDIQGNREKITTVDMPSVKVMKEYIESFSSKYENKLGIYKDELVYYKPDNEVKNKVTDKEEKWLQDLEINKKVVETTEESFEWGSDDPNNSEYYTLKKFIGKETDVIIPKRCHKIGNDAFKNSKVTSVKMQDGIIDIGDGAFDYCTNLVNLNLPDSLEYIGVDSFKNCKKLEEIKIPDKVQYIPTRAFYGCYSLKSIVLPDGLWGIHPGAFKYCSSLKSIDIPSSLGYIASEAFSESAIININIPSSTENIEQQAFSNCANLESINVDEKNKSYCSVDGVLYNKKKDTLLSYPCGKKNETYEVLNGTINIEKDAMYYCKNLKQIKFPEGLINIGDHSFSGCGISGEVNIPSSVTSIKSSSFSYAEYVTKINVDINNVKYSSQDGVLYNKDKTELIIAPKGLTINNLTLPDSLKVIDSMAFNSCKGITGTLTLGEDLETIKERAFEGCSGINKIVLNNNLKVIEYEAFNCVNASGTVIIPEGVTNVGSYVFFQCNKLESIKCRVSSKPDGWNDGWNKYCNANVVWGYTGD